MSNQIEVRVRADMIWVREGRRYKEGDVFTLTDYAVERPNPDTGVLEEKVITAEQQFSSKTMTRLSPAPAPVVEEAPVAAPATKKKATKKKAVKKVEEPATNTENDESVI